MLTITLGLIALQVAASYYGWQNAAFFRQFTLQPYALARQRNYYTLLTSGFLHADGWHLAANCISLYFLGPVVEFHYANMGFSSYWYVILFLSGVIAASIPSAYLHRNNPAYRTLGSSGGVTAVVFAAILIQPRSYIYLYFAIPMPLALFGVLYVVYSIYQGRRGDTNINHEAHLTGAFYGCIFQSILEPSSLRQIFSLFL